MKNEREEFSQRLANAMEKKGYEPRPNVLLKVFNSSYRGASVTFQTTSRWLGGRAIPNQDKLQVLADLFGVEPQVLRFGKAGKGKVAESQAAWPALGARERQVIDAFLALPPKRRELVGQLIDELAQAGKQK